MRDRESRHRHRQRRDDASATTICLMAYAHVAHDCRLGDQDRSGELRDAGRPRRDRRLGHSGRPLGARISSPRSARTAFIAHNTMVTRDVPPYVMAVGRPAVPHSINVEGLKRRGFSTEQIRNIRRAYRVLYRSGLKLQEALERLERSAGVRGRNTAVRRIHQLKLAQPGSLGAGCRVRCGWHWSRERRRAIRWAPDSSRRCAGASPMREFFGVAGPKMRAAGCEVWEPAESLAVMGLYRCLARAAAPVAAHLATARSLHCRPARRIRGHRCAGYQPALWHAASIGQAFRPSNT